MTSAPLRVGITGANARRGWATDAHLGALRALPQLAIQAVSARTMDIAQEAQALYGAVSAYDDSLALARDPDVDIVAVTVKVPEHRAIVMAAIAAGKHIYCEWPLGRDLAEAREMAQAAQAAGVHVAIGLQGANSLAVRHAAKLVQEGAIGRPLTLRVVSPTAGWGAESPAHYAYLQDKRNGATLSTIAGGHTLAAIEAVVGDYADVTALASIVQGKMKLSGTDEFVARTCADHLLVSGRHVGGCVSSLEVVGGVTDVPFEFVVDPYDLRRASRRLPGRAAGRHNDAGQRCTAGSNHPRPRRPARQCLGNVGTLCRRHSHRHAHRARLRPRRSPHRAARHDRSIVG
jgi:predicted dehydrogenase